MRRFAGPSQPTSEIVRIAPQKTTGLSLSPGPLLVYQLPSDVDPGGLAFNEKDGHLALTATTGDAMNLAEFIHGGH